MNPSAGRSAPPHASNRSPWVELLSTAAALAVLASVVVGCGDDGSKPASAPSDPTAASSTAPGAATKPVIQVPALPDDLPNALVLALSAFDARKPGDQGPPGI